MTTSLCICGNKAYKGTQCRRCTSLQALGLARGASETEIEDAYRVLIKVWHPDRFDTDPELQKIADEKLKAINGAYSYLRTAPEPPPVPPAPRPKAAPKARVARKEDEAGARSALLAMLGLRAMLIVVALAAFLVPWFLMDSFFSSNPEIARVYLPYKAAALHGVTGRASQSWSDLKVWLHLKPSTLSPLPAAAPVPNETADAAPAPAPHAIDISKLPHIRNPRPYVTLGLTRAEVIAALGQPTAATPLTLQYGASQVFFSAGKVSGWKLDGDAPALRVKLWPATSIPVAAKTFSKGSSRDVVLAVQGTPSLLADNVFGYGNSEVFFEGGRVVGWKNDPATVPLHVTQP